MVQSLQFFRRIMLLLNVTVGAFLVWVFGMTPVLAARQSDGVAFAQNLSALPAKPWTLVIAVLGMAALILAGVLRRRGQNFIGWIEPLFALCVIFALHLAYNGLLLYVVVDLIDGLHGRTRRRFLGAMTALFLLTGLGALQGALHVVPFSEYLLYFDMHTRQLLQSVVDLLGALHLILFVVYMVVLIGQRTEENSAIRRLNGELEQANDRLSVMNEQLKAYAAESERMAETRERNRLAREIHDTLGHALTGITAGADACIQMLEISPEMAKKQMERIASTAREGMNEVRRSVRALRPDALEPAMDRELWNQFAQVLTRHGSDPQNIKFAYSMEELMLQLAFYGGYTILAEPVLAQLPANKNLTFIPLENDTVPAWAVWNRENISPALRLLLRELDIDP